MKFSSLIISALLLLSLAGGLAASDSRLNGESEASSQSHTKHKDGRDDSQSHKEHKRMADKAMAGPMKAQEIGVTEKLGMTVQKDVSLIDEKGSPVILETLLDKPVILLPVFYSCARVCGLQMAYLAEALKSLDSFKWDEYRIITFSFDAEDIPQISSGMKKNYLPLISEKFPEDSWRFFTGEQKAIDQLLSSIGYQAKKAGPAFFLHPSAMVVLAPGGKIIRYLYGPKFLPFDVGMALAEAFKGTPGVSIKRVLTYCFNYDPSSKRYVFQYFRIIGGLILILLLGFFWFFLRKGAGRSES